METPTIKQRLRAWLQSRKLNKQLKDGTARRGRTTNDS